MELFNLVGKVFVDTKDTEESLQKTSDKAEKTGKTFSEGVKKAAKWGTALVGAATAVGGAMVASAKSTAENLDVIDKASIRMGITAEQYQELAYAAGLSGVEMSTLEAAAKKLAATGSEMDLNEALNQIAGITDETERTNAAFALFGEQAYNMTPLLAAGSEGMAAMRQEANELGLVMSQDAVTQGAAMNDMFSKVEQSVGTLKNQLVSEFMPYVMEILQWVIDNIPKIKKTVSSVMSAIMPIVRPVINAIMAVLPPIMSAIQNLMEWITPYIKPIITGLTAFINGVMALFRGDFQGFLDGIKNMFRNIGGALFNIGKDVFNRMPDGIKSTWSTIKSWVSDKVSWLKDKLAFWRSGKNEMNAHASGLAYVPYDNYPALLHRGERVLTAQQNADYASGDRNVSNAFNITVNAGAGQDARSIAKAVADAIADLIKRKELALT